MRQNSNKTKELPKRSLISEVLQEQRELFDQKLAHIESSSVKREKLRDLEHAFSKLDRQNQAIFISGLRRVGKSTLLSQFALTLKQASFYYVNFEDERFVSLKTSDLNLLHEVLMELFGPAKILLLDEIQVVKGWERWVRRLIDTDNKLVITGSNAELLSRELGTKLTGRYKSIDLFPFSFREQLTQKEITFQGDSPLMTAQRSLLLAEFNKSIVRGGIPMYSREHDPEGLRTLFQDIVQRDVVSRFQIRAFQAVRELAVVLASNIARLTAYKKLTTPLGLKGVTTVKNYVEYLQTAWLFFVVNRYSKSVKQQQINPKKIFCIDTGIASAVGIETGDRVGYFLENIVFLELRRLTREIYYYQTQKGQEVDLFLPRSNLFVQVSFSIADPGTRKRELAALEQAMQEREFSKGVILTMHELEEIELEDKVIPVFPIYEVLRSGKLRERFLGMVEGEFGLGEF